MAEPDKAVFTYQDQANKKSTSTLYFTTGLTLAQISEGLIAFATLLDSVTGAIITAVTSIFSADLSALTDNTTSGLSDIEEVGEFVMMTSDNRKVVMNVPGIDSTLSVAGSDDLDQSDPDVAAMFTAIEDGIAVTGGTIVPCDIGENDLVQVAYARERVVNSGKRA
jgi:hypothetical protein